MLHDAEEHRRRRWSKVVRLRALGDLFDQILSAKLRQFVPGMTEPAACQASRPKETRHKTLERSSAA